MDTKVLPIYNTEGKETGKAELDKKVFDGTVNTHAIYQAVNCYRANQHKGIASTKTRGEVSGGGKKPWRQKGTGRARAGSIRSPLWRHGGVVFGPHPRDFSYSLPQKIKNLALKSSLNVKVKDNNLLILENMDIANDKTKAASAVFSKLKLSENKKKQPSVLLLVNKLDEGLKLALRNLPYLSVDLARNTHVYEVMANKKLVVTSEALDELVKRLK